MFQIERKEFKSKMKAGAFKLNMHPTSYFNENPYRSDKHLPKLKPRRSMSSSRISNKVFLCSSPGKSSAGCHAGTFDPFPKYIHEPYKRKGKAGTKFKGNKPFYPNQHLKSRPYTSILKQNVKMLVLYYFFYSYRVFSMTVCVFVMFLTIFFIVNFEKRVKYFYTWCT